MDETLRRLAPLSGPGAIVLFAIGMILAAGGTPDFAGPAEEAVAYYSENTGSLVASAILVAIATPLLAWFLGSLRAGIARAEGGAGRLASTAFGAGVATLALLVASVMINAMGAIRADQAAGIAPESAVMFFDLTSILFGAAAPAAFAATLLATAVASLRYRAVLPGWLAVVSIVLAIVNVIPPIAWVGIFVSLLWIAVVGILLYLQQATVEPEPAAGAARS